MRIRAGRRAGFVRAAVWVAVAVLARASAAEAADARLTLENDNFNFWQKPDERPDFGYTHGTAFALRLPRAKRGFPRGLPQRWLAGAGGDAALEIRIQQDLYSPWNLYNPERTGPDRDYAGWLGVSAGASCASERSRRTLMLLAGVTGPPSLASAVQRAIHRNYDHGARPDWSNQLPFEPGFGLEASSIARTFRRGRSEGASLALAPSALARLATYSVTTHAGLTLMAGWKAPGLWPGAAARLPGPSLHVKLEPRVEWVGRDEFLDGTLFKEHPGPGTRRWVAESRATAGAGWSALGLEYSVTRRSREFEGQPRPHTYSSLALIWSPGLPGARGDGSTGARRVSDGAAGE